MSDLDNADADHVLGLARPTLNVFRTDKTDKETTIVESDAFEDFCITLNSCIPAVELRASIYDAAFPLGAVRRQAAQKGLALDFKQIPFHSFILEGPICNVDRCCAEVKGVNPHTNISVGELIELVQDETIKRFPRPLEVRGHDLTAILSVQSRLLFGRQVSQTELEFELMRTYLMRHFAKTGTYADMLQWETTIAPNFKIF